MNITVNNIKVPLSATKEMVFEAALSVVRLHSIKADNPEIYRKSIDARRKKVSYVYSVKMRLLSSPHDIPDNSDIRILKEEKVYIRRDAKLSSPVIVGSGPCGLFAAYVLSEAGYKPIIIERGADVETRTKSVEEFFKTGKLNKSSNVQFGEGGAGTFSDGKLNTRIGDPLERFVLNTFVKFGAHSDILVDAKPHIGTDVLKTVLKNMRRAIEEKGGKYIFNATVTDIIIKNNCICGVVLNEKEELKCDKLILAIGHSSRDTYEMLYKKGFVMQQKAFAAGVRIEHKQSFINELQYGEDYKKYNLPASPYRIVYNGKERSCYSFCMCPGGIVVNASSEKSGFAVNGMSNFARDGENANSALVVNVKPEDFESSSPLAGVEFQRKYERLAYKISGGYKAPVQLSEDFIKGKVSDKFNGVIPSFTGETVFADLRSCLPEFITDTLKEALVSFENKMTGFVSSGSVLTGVETRTSAPLRLLRGEDGQALNIKGVFPAGEGAGYAGGIMSAAIDGIKIAEKLVN